MGRPRAGGGADHHLHLGLLDLEEAEFVLVFPLKGKGRMRLVGVVREMPEHVARELTFEEVADVTSTAGIETEVFIHGALCYAYSGLCLFSSQTNGRSGNRGKCAYSCRDEFQISGAPETLRENVRRIAHPRSLPTAGKTPLLDSQEVLLHPQSCQSANILVRQDVRYVVLYRVNSGADLAGFAADAAHYQQVFENPSVIIYATHRTGCG